MKRFALFLFLAIALPVMATETGIQWFGDFEKAMERARAEEKPLIMDFYAEWCGPCKRMDQETYPNAELAALIKAQYVAVRIDVDEHYELAKKYGGNALPAIVVINAEDNELYRHHGFLSAQQLKENLLSLAGVL